MARDGQMLLVLQYRLYDQDDQDRQDVLSSPDRQVRRLAHEAQHHRQVLHEQKTSARKLLCLQTGF